MRKIQKTICIEELLSRIPSLFPYCGFNEIGIFTRHKATESHVGSYGKLMCGFVLPVPLITEKCEITDEGVTWNGDTVLEYGGSYSYRTIMNAYYKYRNGKTDIIMKCVGVYAYNPLYGRIDTNCVSDKLIRLDDYDAFKAQMNDKYGSPDAWMAYERDVVESVDIRDVKIVKYTNEGSDVYVTEEHAIYDGIDTYEPCGTYDNFIKFIDRGIGKVYISECIEEFNSLLPPDSEYIIPSDIIDKCSKIPDYVYLSRVRILYDKMVKLKKIVTKYLSDKDGLKSLCCDYERYLESGGDSMLLLYEYLNGNAEKIAQEYYEIPYNIDSVCFNINLNITNNEIGYLTPDARLWSPGTVVQPNEIILNTDDDGITRSYVNDGDEPVDFFDSELNRYSFDLGGLTRNNDTVWYKSDEDFVEGYTDSKLQSLVCYPSYMSIYDDPEYPKYGEDWLFRYKKGEVIDYRVKFDGDGEISLLTDDAVLDNDGYVVNLDAYGNVITDISLNFEENTITFNYIIDGHLKRKRNDVVIDENNKDDFHFVLDIDSEYGKFSGMRYTDVFILKNSDDWDDFRSDDNAFEEYIVTDIKKRGFKKYPFSTYVSNDTCNIKYGTASTNVRFIKSKYTKAKKIDQSVYVLSHEDTVTGVDEENNEIIKDVNKYGVETDKYSKDIMDNDSLVKVNTFKEDYLIGVEYQPIVYNNVKVERGVNSAFEKHLRLGEVKTLSDMEDFQNGSFFNIKKF